MATRTYVVEIEVHEHVSESMFGTSMVKGLQDGDIHRLSFLHHNIVDITVRPYEEPQREWEVYLSSGTDPFGNNTAQTVGYRGTEAQVMEMARQQFPNRAIIGTRIKE